MSISYRPEIDGLRAIAVLAVVLYHAGVGGAGFVGVDVFFAISGYLITSLLLREHAETGAIDLLAFYARRVRRIFPAVAVVVLAVLLAAPFFLSPGQTEHTANSAGAALIFGANIFFQFMSGGYFDGRSEEMPLLHLWSLSVEEQFYFLWPALLLLLLRARVNLLTVLVGLAAASFLLAEWLMPSHPAAAFYQTPARFWELAAGGIIATRPVRTVPRGMTIAGIVLTLVACVIPFGHFPGLGALPAVLGACLIIAPVHGGASNAFLRSRPMVAIGLISYSLYLWHWPLLAFYRATSIGDGSLNVRLELCAVAVLLAFASYRYIEQPFRRLRVAKGRTVLVGSSVSIALALSACALARHAYGDDDPLAVKAEADKPERTCHEQGLDPVMLKCGPVPETRVGIWGDSMAYAWTPLAQALDPKAAVFSRDACGPFLGFLPDKLYAQDMRCRDFTEQVVKRVQGLDTLILVARWQPDPARFDGLARTLATIATHVRHIEIIGPTPEMRDEVGRCARKHDLDACAISRASFDAQAAPILSELRRLSVGHPNVTVIDPANLFCTTVNCPPVKDGVPLYWDSHHVTKTAALAAKPLFLDGAETTALRSH
jgi:peptidoglycan/LPS O-acetylase OafA/YrhL